MYAFVSAPINPLTRLALTALPGPFIAVGNRTFMASFRRKALDRSTRSGPVQRRHHSDQMLSALLDSASQAQWPTYLRICPSSWSSICLALLRYFVADAAPTLNEVMALLVPHQAAMQQQVILCSQYRPSCHHPC
jgi:hypothetical protein